MVIRQKKALFTRKPRVLGEVDVLAAVENLKPIKVEKTIILTEDDYRNFITDMTVERQFLKRYNALCKIDDEGIWHCLLVVLQGSQAGILVMADKDGFPDYAALFWSKSDMYSPPLLQQYSSSSRSC
jgi:hypothetical protein